MANPAASQDDLLKEGIAAARAGQAAQARACLLPVVQADERNVQAWYWLSRVVESPKEREICLENVLALDPGHAAVQSELAALRTQTAQAQEPARAAVEFIPATPEECLISNAAVEPLPCPYCGAQADPLARQCPTCGRAISVRERKSKGHSLYSLGLVLIWFGLANYVWLGLSFYYLGSDLTAMVEASPRWAATLQKVAELLSLKAPALDTLALPPAPVLLAGGGAFALSLVIAAGLYYRIRFAYWLTVGLILLGSILLFYNAITAETWQLARLVVALVLFLAATSFVFAAHDEFAWVERRLAAVLDPDADSHSALYARGRRYADQGMWARAVVHWAKAVALNPGHPDYRLALASGYINLGQPERGLEHLEQARRIEPDNPQIPELSKRIPTSTGGRI
ncbi:MAG: tetratricopeptide repeat protein [Anaerolineae bacterium]|nr:tetratricopeptide repeat protein [Anaerolineae bacterium]